MQFKTRTAISGNSSSLKGIFGIVDVEPGEWLIDLEHPEKNTAHCSLRIGRYYKVSLTGRINHYI